MNIQEFIEQNQLALELSERGVVDAPSGWGNYQVFSPVSYRFTADICLSCKPLKSRFEVGDGQRVD